MARAAVRYELCKVVYHARTYGDGNRVGSREHLFQLFDITPVGIELGVAEYVRRMLLYPRLAQRLLDLSARYAPCIFVGHDNGLFLGE